MAKLAFKAWFRIKPGNKEIKDKWWALYYRKLHPKWHLRDNHLGRKINMWIEEEVDRLRDPDQSKLHAVLPMRPGRKPKNATLTLSEGAADGAVERSPNMTMTGKKRKANSSKEGTQPAYMHVELQQPPKSLAGELPDYLKPLLSCLRDGDTLLEWSKETLDEDVQWFRASREQIMNQIPTIVGRPRLTLHSPPHHSVHGAHGVQVKKHKSELEVAEGVSVETDQEWVRCDVLKSSDEIIIRVDLPGCTPAHDFELQTGTEGGFKLIVKGERKADPSAATGAATYVHQSRPLGRFQLVIGLPTTADLAKTEQTFSCGVLTVKVPLALTHWRTLDVLTVGQ